MKELSRWRARRDLPRRPPVPRESARRATVRRRHPSLVRPTPNGYCLPPVTCLTPDWGASRISHNNAALRCASSIVMARFLCYITDSQNPRGRRTSRALRDEGFPRIRELSRVTWLTAMDRRTAALPLSARFGEPPGAVKIPVAVLGYGSRKEVADHRGDS